MNSILFTGMIQCSKSLINSALHYKDVRPEQLHSGECSLKGYLKIMPDDEIPK